MRLIRTNNGVPKYAILSHVWEEEEVTMGPIWQKIDTCCIDKSSSAELSDTINSMYRYYRKAEVCYAYLTDVRSDVFSQSFDFRMCQWFTRGWTLQELIAPETVIFFTKDWEKIGTKASPQETLTEITGIPSGDLLSRADLRGMSIAARMSWAARRKTTCIEDRAYSLMGIFDVFMPPIYSEGEYTFIRLQEEILKVSNDYTIFAWEDKSSFSSATSPDMS
ncbi:hypothetical protein BDP27DRAFT_1481352 [Rhodocollybia butyracea]|uniref:Heterokaryon incompatibility domain-containing protein n=1 Tax=Rhodocollybia butyracea TaxID=206335 RepID=A0A9P5PGC7_9AGAR|nr:hypothetical protein BDP27DRAFT_1481352 [Rhodocollybia butyracea]